MTAPDPIRTGLRIGGTRALLADVTRRQQHADRVHRRVRRAALVLSGAVTAVIVAPATPALAHSTATSCTHSSVGLFHVQTFVVGKWTNGRHVHTVQLTHPFDDTPEYDSIACAK